jgi:thiamine biosynthesis lipoprotein
MGTIFKIILYAPDERLAKEASDAAFARIGELNKKLSDYDPESELSRLGAMTDDGPMSEPVPVSDDLWTVLVAAQETSRRSQGAFDVSVGPLTKLWRQARRAQRLPSPEKLAAARESVGYEAIELDEKGKRVRLAKPRMRLDLGGIAKGYATDEALAVLRKHGVTAALIDAGGGMTLGEAPLGEEGWPVGLASLDPSGTPVAVLKLSNCGVATSGDAHQYVEIDGVRYSHILDPRTGVGLKERMSASVIAPTGTQADALTKAVCILGEAGLKIIDETEGARAILVREENGKAVAIESKRFKSASDKPRREAPAADTHSAPSR